MALVETTARSRTIGGMVIGAIIMSLLLVLFSCTVSSDLQSFGYAYHRDENGYMVTVDVDKGEQVPSDWTCQPKKDAFRTLTCEVPVKGAQEPMANALTEQEVRDLVQEEVDRLRAQHRVEPVKPDPPEDGTKTSWADVAMVVFAGLGVLIAGVGLVWGIYTQREHVAALIAWVRRSPRIQVGAVRVAPGPLRHPRRSRRKRTDR